MYKIFLILIVAMALHAKIVDGIAVVVEGEAITLLDIKKEMQQSGLDTKAASEALIRKTLEEEEIQKRGIGVDSMEVYEEIKKTAARNNMDVSKFYDAVRNANGITSSELKEKIKEKLLSNKLYSAISYSQMSQPTDDEIKEYYELHKDEFTHPSSFTVAIYSAADQTRLQAKINNPMLYAPDIHMQEQTIEYDRVAPQLAALLERTPVNTFTSIIPNGQGAFMTFYIKSVEKSQSDGFENQKNQIMNQIMAKKREQVLGDYFARLRLNADIKIIRMPKDVK